MRITDDLSHGVSTFYAELKRVKQILDFTETNQGSLFLIDELFKGTNSVDRLAGAQRVIERLHEKGASGLISTHDLELCDLERAYERVKNKSFSESYENNRICFDYKIKPGKSNTTNAKFLMDMIGISG
jgi:DNA mismatch repair ATPase MutS